MRRFIDLYKEFTSFEGSLFKYSLSFSFLLALAPSLVIIVMLFKYDLLPIDMIIDFIMSFMPYESSETTVTTVIQFFLDRQYNLVSFIITLCVSFYLASKIVFSFLLISASHEEIEVPKWAIRIKSVVLFILFLAVLIISVAVATFLKDYLPLVSSVLMLVLFTLAYRALSFRKRHWSFGILGAIFTTFMILCLASLFITIINHFTRYQDVYGPLASLVALFLAIYLISCIIYFGFCLNIVFEDEYRHESKLPMKNPKYFAFCVKITDYIQSKVIDRKK
ncbi:YihY/virulence factor BrkB family protein [[Eubacterium] hominis]|uniref:YihY/virulence factor BrkB family protein n=1 Tax=[Eubacterium] hominis TaxID=2764325 RepID=UPI003A4D7F29